MLKKNHWSIPGFTCIAMLSLSACGSSNGHGNLGTPGGAGGSGAGGGGETPVVDFTVPNVYATGVDGVAVSENLYRQARNQIRTGQREGDGEFEDRWRYYPS